MTAFCVGGPHDGLAITAEALPRRRKLQMYCDTAHVRKQVFAHYELRGDAYEFVRIEEVKRRRRFSLPGTVAFKDAV